VPVQKFEEFCSGTVEGKDALAFSVGKWRFAIANRILKFTGCEFQDVH
jgi:hypothetical protein